MKWTLMDQQCHRELSAAAGGIRQHLACGQVSLPQGSLHGSLWRSTRHRHLSPILDKWAAANNDRETVSLPTRENERHLTRLIGSSPNLWLRELPSSSTGGLICKDGQRFRWSEIRTDNMQEQVTVPDTLCPLGTIAAHFHTHPPLESPVPSGNDRSDLIPPQELGGDYNNARTHPGIPYYLRAPIPNSPVQPPKETHTLKYWWTGTGALPSQNVCKRATNGSWIPYAELSPNANCSTPNP